MPAFVAAVGAWIAANAVSLVVMAASTLYGRNRAASAKRKAAAQARAQAEAARAAMNLKFNAASSVGNIPVIYGRVRTGGYFALQEVSADKKFLHIVLVHAEGQCGPRGELYLDGTSYTDRKFKVTDRSMVKNGTTRVRRPDGIYDTVDVLEEQTVERSLVHWEYFDGSDAQPACQTLIDALPGKWTADHKLSGVCYSYVRLEWNPDVWRATPLITVDLNGKVVFDPRTSGMVPSTNPALALRDYLISPRYGRGLNAAEVSDASIISAANYCDQLINMGHATPVARYAISGMVDTAKACLDNVQELLEHMRGSLLFHDGVYRLVVDRADTPVMTFDADTMVGKWSFKRADRRERLNQLTGRFVDPARNFEESVVTIKNADWRAKDGGVLLESQRDYSLAYDERRARYLAERDLRDARNDLSVQFTALAIAQRVQPTDVIAITNETTGWFNKQFRVLTVKPLPSGEVEITAHEYDAGLYADTPLSALPPPPQTSLPDPFAILPAPTGLALQTDNQVLWSGEVVPRLRVTWSPVLGLLSDYVVRFRAETEAEWQYVRTRDPIAYVPAMPGQRYVVSVAAVSSFGRTGEFANVSGEALAPSGSLENVTGLVCEFGPAGDFIYRWQSHDRAKQYAVEIITDGITRRSEVITTERYVYTLAMNRADGINRTVTFRIKAVSSAGLVSAEWVSKTETNAPPVALAGLSAWSNSLAIAFSCVEPTENDIAGVVCHLGDAPVFEPSAATLAYQGRLDRPTLLTQRNAVPLEVGKTYFLRVAAFDLFGQDGLEFSPSLEVKIFSLSASILALESIGPEQLSTALMTKVNSADGAASAVETIKSNLAATWMVATDVNGKISGVKAYNNGNTSSFDVLADVFRISTPGSLEAGEAVFSVGSVNGVNKAGLRGDLFIDGSIAARALSVDKLQSITASTGELYVTGDLHMTAGAILGGARWGWSWGPAGNMSQNMYFGPKGLLLGSANAGKYIQYDASNGGLTIAGGMIKTPDGNSYLNLNAGPTEWVFHTPNAAIRKDGYAYFGNVTVRGDVHATSVKAGVVTADSIVARGITNVFKGEGTCYYAVPYSPSIILVNARLLRPNTGWSTSPASMWLTEVYASGSISLPAQEVWEYRGPVQGNVKVGTYNYEITVLVFSR